MGWTSLIITASPTARSGMTHRKTSESSESILKAAIRANIIIPGALIAILMSI